MKCTRKVIVFGMERFVEENYDELEKLEDPDQVDEELAEDLKLELRKKNSCPYRVETLAYWGTKPFCRQEEEKCGEVVAECPIYGELEGTQTFYQAVREKYLGE